MSFPMLPALGTIFAPAAGAGAAAAGAGAAAAAGAGAAAAAGTSAFATIMGGVVSGIGTAMMKKNEYKQEEAMREAEDRRVRDSYEGAGDAVRFWDQGQNPESEQAASTNNFERADAQSNEGLRVGQTEKRQRLGEQYRNRMETGAKRFRYDRNAGQIVQA
ncbi:hypothetical protein [Phaeobacter gallaeciensis]|uniref:hypothetical protein n=1 Tax=Phaeobacter gallaeciensis TaxID=60890 RepID=UPI00237F9880|nr:hypothetical protein [Phaeobacter gallaeciensis]MDE4189680.1 hypothetical protein [Phaeobacter gallaeciensis]MDE4198832.1 hypothetical protein [Phaeobacter gallaeciensis]MDE4202980.1 hypothetical protein [Phaeobacter gallaeciensis]MDE4207122.1 hypothetical protein [Phaeobacter gallaeciensis]MDE4215654.1 hypothetical protein [Phaeobacter gallaeciensis]